MIVNKLLILEEFLDFSKVKDETIRKRLEKFHQESIDLLKKFSPKTQFSPSVLSLHAYQETGGYFTQPGTKGSKIIFNKDNNILIRFLDPLQKTITFIEKNKVYNLMIVALILRHEVYEAIEMAAKEKALKRPIQIPEDADGMFKQGHHIIGMHVSANVLNHEAYDAYLFRDFPAGQDMKKLRISTGEYNAIKRSTGVDLTKMDGYETLLKNEKIIKKYEAKRRKENKHKKEFPYNI